MQDPAWIVEAKKHIGLREIPGPKDNGVILGWLKSLKAWWSNESVPWCGTFAAHCVRSAGLPIPKDWMRATAWLSIGKVLPKPAEGCIVVFSREGGGHVGFVVGKDKQGHLMVLGGNQGDAVSIRPFDTGRVLGYRWPSVSPLPERYNLQIIDSDGKVSMNEA